MIGFGELRKKSAAWQMGLDAVEKIYAFDWLLKGLFDHGVLRTRLSLRGAAALANAYFAEYPRVAEADFARDPVFDDAALKGELAAAAAEAAQVSGLVFRLESFRSSEARVEFTGPLGRRSAAQPSIILRFFTAPPRAEPVARPLLHPFGDPCPADVRAVALEELAAERVVLYARKPRARDVYDLWFILTHGTGILDRAQTRALAQTIAQERRVALRAELDPNYAPLLERAWQGALKNIQTPPSFARAADDLHAQLEELLGQQS